MEGTVKFFNRKKGFGFIAGDDGKDYFVHFTGLSKGTFLRDNDKVSFETDEGERGPKAVNVTLLQKASDRPDLPHEEGSEDSENEDSEESDSEESEESDSEEEKEGEY